MEITQRSRAGDLEKVFVVTLRCAYIYIYAYLKSYKQSVYQKHKYK